jgi:hypothetical protein
MKGPTASNRSGLNNRFPCRLAAFPLELRPQVMNACRLEEIAGDSAGNET